MQSLKTNAELRQAARAQLKGKWKFVVLLTLIYGVISSIPSGITSNFDGRFALLGFILSALITGPLTLGLAICFLKFVRDEELRFENLFDGFKNFLPAFLLTLLTGIFTMLWTLLLIIPGIIAALRYSMSFYILADNPEISAMDAIKQSKELMRGNKGKLFLLSLSFIGWAILSTFTLFIGLLWLIPYIQTSIANFYEDLKTSVEAKAL
jgi:uncharacterized membrane protein